MRKDVKSFEDLKEGKYLIVGEPCSSIEGDMYCICYITKLTKDSVEFESIDVTTLDCKGVYTHDKNHESKNTVKKTFDTTIIDKILETAHTLYITDSVEGKTCQDLI